MIDLRCHILDGTPCGPDSLSESLEMCRLAAADDVRTIVATPRWEAGCDEPPLPFAECRRKLERLEKETQGAISLKLGFVLQFSAELPALVARHGSKLALAGKQHLLISLPSIEVPVEVEGVWKALARSGFSVLLAHPECSTVLRRDTARLARWVSEGMRLQVDAASVLGTHGREVQRFALECVRQFQGRAVIASNARPGAYQKSPFSKVFKELAGRVGARRASTFIRETPAALIEDDAAQMNNQERPPSGLTSFLRSVHPVKALMGDS